MSICDERQQVNVFNSLKPCHKRRFCTYKNIKGFTASQLRPKNPPPKQSGNMIKLVKTCLLPVLNCIEIEHFGKEAELLSWLRTFLCL